MIRVVWDIARWILVAWIALFLLRDAVRTLRRWRRLAYPLNGVPRTSLVNAMRAVRWSIGAAVISSCGWLLHVWLGSPWGASMGNICLGAYLVSLVLTMLAWVTLVLRINREESRQPLGGFDS